MNRIRPRGGLALLTLLATGLGLLTPVAEAAPAPNPAPARTQEAKPGKAPVPLKDRGPIPADSAENRRDYSAEKSRGLTASAAACDAAEFTSRTGPALVQHIRASSVDCVNSLFQLTGSTATAAFRESQMISVANGLRDNASTYPGDNSTATQQVVLYLRAGYFVQWYNPDVVGPYGPALRTAIQAALDTFFNNSRAFTLSDANGPTLGESVILIDSAQENARYLWVVKRLLDGYSTAYDPYPSMTGAVNSAYTVLFRGHYLPEFVSAVAADSSVLTSLSRLAQANLHLLGTSREYLVVNAGRELGRFLQHTSIRPAARALVKGLLDRTSITGPTAHLWAGAAEMADAYDKADCAYYGVCDLKNRLTAAILPINHSCGATLRIRAQQMTAAELSSSCGSLLNQDAFFHRTVNDPGPVANDNNTTLEVVAFDSSSDYQTYAGILFGIDTNNGGMYLEGDPAVVGNQPRFIAYEAEWLRPAFEVWNLNHEYTHYLDGRYNMYGDFPATVATPTVWWIEGVAEYVSYSYRGTTNTAAIAEAGKHTYALNTLFDTSYDHDANRVYRWGYLAVRYMMQSHPADTATLLGHYRAGNYTAARTLLKTTIGSRYENDWNAWLTACAAGNCGATTPALPECTGSDVRALGKNCQRGNRSAANSWYDHLYLFVPPGTAQVTITSAGGTGDCDLYYSPSTWATPTTATHRSTNSGTAESIVVTAPPGNTYVYISLKGATACSGVAVATRF
ncbi:Microbial collagenase, secreted [Alloactinosynnema sp. L-07]|uniref:M9 family metallopeptidase n=1 Tax=Alloactinosynnema sp. L-07 TaxID=1653480 RepID=UPI00065F069B|nr:M9 family metallopeptidase [Alloactinosynnema sp. L-07]CRK56022.1 Microbial collagenase, secreted [Alloactinosynnema sp. L-07]